MSNNDDPIIATSTSRRMLLAFTFGVIAASPLVAAEDHRLVMVEEPGCPYCVRWHAEVGPAYANSPEGKFAPLQRAHLGTPQLAGIKGLRYTPTFVLMAGEREIGRITGYPGADFFWGMLTELLAKTSFGRPAAPVDVKT